MFITLSIHEGSHTDLSFKDVKNKTKRKKIPIALLLESYIYAIAEKDLMQAFK